MWFVFLVRSTTLRSAQGHGYIIEPPARNIIDGSGNGNCPHCGNGAKSVCGDGGQWPSSMYYVQAVQQPHRTYVAGSTVKIEISMNVNHKGHHEFFICDSAVSSNAGAVACFQKWPLRRASPEEIHSDCQVNDAREDCQPVDINYPGRWYHPPGKSKHSIHYRIPDGLSCTHCTLLWFWPTSNSAPYDVPAYSCYAQQLRQQGWNVFDFCGWACNQGACPSNYVPTNNAPDPNFGSGFEEFRNCADIRVTSSSGGPAQLPTPFPTPLPTAPTPQPPPTAQPTFATSSDCSGQPCSSASHCRSKWGFCGATGDYCNSESTWSLAACSEPRPTQSPTLRPTLAPTFEPTSAEPEPESEPESEPEQDSEPEIESSCRGQPCSSPSRCRSKWGFCGESIAYCNNESIWTATGCDFVGTSPMPTLQTMPTLLPATPSPTVRRKDAAPPSPCVPTISPYSLYCAQESEAGRCPSPWCESNGNALVQEKSKAVRKHQHFLGASLVQQSSSVDQAELGEDSSYEL